MTARGHVYKSGGTWFFVVWADGRVVHADDTGNWRTVYDECYRSALAFDYVTNAGHRLKKSWSQIVDKAARDL